MFNKELIGSLIIVIIFLYNLYEWMNEEKRKQKKLIELKNFIRSLDTEDNDTLDNIINKKSKDLIELTSLRNLMNALSNKVKNLECLDIEKEWKNIFENTIANFKMPQILYQNILSLGEVINSYDIEIKKNKIRDITNDLNHFIKQTEEKFNKEKIYKIKLRVIISMLLLIINV